MLFLAASKGNYFQWTSEHDVVRRSPVRGQIRENIAAALNSLQQPKFRVTASQEPFEIGIHFELQIKDKSCAAKIKPPESNNTGRKNNKFAIVD